MSERGVESATPARVDEHYLRSAHEGVNFPAQRWQIVAWAEHNGAGLRLVSALRATRERTYQDLAAVAYELKRA
jgi:hypothetical protein